MEFLSFKSTYSRGWYEKWSGLLEWNTGLDYWTELLSFFGQVFEFTFGSLHALKFTSSWLLWMITIMTIVDYHSVFITKSKYTFENTAYLKILHIAKCLRWKSVVIFWSLDWQP